MKVDLDRIDALIKAANDWPPNAKAWDAQKDIVDLAYPMAQELRGLRASLADECGWLIETSIFPTPLYLFPEWIDRDGVRAFSSFWTEDANKAVRFSNRESAEATLAWLRLAHREAVGYWSCAKVTEHMWCGTDRVS